MTYDMIVLSETNEEEQRGASYIRWGRKVCEGNATLVYKGDVCQRLCNFISSKRKHSAVTPQTKRSLQINSVGMLNIFSSFVNEYIVNNHAGQQCKSATKRKL